MHPLERNVERFYQLGKDDYLEHPNFDSLSLLKEAMLQRELIHKRIVNKNVHYNVKLIGWIEVI